MSPFHYAKVNNENSIHDAVEQEHDHITTKRWSRTLEKFKLLKWPVTFLLLSAILTCELSTLPNGLRQLQLGGEINGLIPNFSTEKRTFYTDTRYASDHKTLESINATKAQWIDLMPRGAGFIRIADPASYTLPPPMSFPQTPGKPIYALAIFHQLHCLMHLSHTMDKLVLQLRNKNYVVDESVGWHTDHCFNYLRNAVLCCGDTALEGQAQSERFGGRQGRMGRGRCMFVGVLGR